MFHGSYSTNELVPAFLELLDVAVTVALLLFYQVVQPALVRLQVQVLLHLFPEVFDLRGRAVGKMVKLGDGQIPIILVQVEFLEDVPALLEVAIDGVAVVIDGKAEVEQLLYLLVLQGRSGADVCLVEALLELEQGARVDLHLLGARQQVHEPLEVLEEAALAAALDLEVLVAQELLQHLVLVDELRVDEAVQHLLEPVLPVVEELLVHSSEVGEVGLQALLRRQLGQDEALVPAAEVVHEPLELGVPAVDLVALEHDVVFEDGLEEALAELVVASYLHGFLGSDVHDLRLGDLEQQLLGALLLVGKVAHSVLVDDVLFDDLQLLLRGEMHFRPRFFLFQGHLFDWLRHGLAASHCLALPTLFSLCWLL